MVVHTRSRDGRFQGIHIGAENVRRYFPPSQSGIELLLGHLQIHCELKPEFWQGQPEIDDSRLADWLEVQCHRDRTPGGCVSLTMSRAGDNCFRIEIARDAPSPAPRTETRVGTRPARIPVDRLGME